MPKYVGGAFAFVVLATALVGGSFAHWDPTLIDQVYWKGDPIEPCFLNAAACGGHFLGSDEVGRDLISRILVGTRISLGNAFVALMLEALLGIAFGAFLRFSGAVGRFIGGGITGALSSFSPWVILVVISIFSEVGRSVNLRLIEFVAALLFAPKLAQLIAAATSGPPTRAVFDRLARDFGNLILLLATVDFLGRGVQPPTPSLGNIAVDALAVFPNGWWIPIFPWLALFLIVLAIEVARRTYLGLRETAFPLGETKNPA